MPSASASTGVGSNCDEQIARFQIDPCSTEMQDGQLIAPSMTLLRHTDLRASRMPRARMQSKLPIETAVITHPYATLEPHFPGVILAYATSGRFTSGVPRGQALEETASPGCSRALQTPGAYQLSLDGKAAAPVEL